MSEHSPEWTMTWLRVGVPSEGSPLAIRDFVARLLFSEFDNVSVAIMRLRAPRSAGTIAGAVTLAEWALEADQRTVSTDTVTLARALLAADEERRVLREALQMWPQDGTVHEHNCMSRFGDECDCYTSVVRKALESRQR